MNAWKKLTALLLALCLFVPCALAEEDVEISLSDIVDDVLLTDDGEEIDDPDGIGEGLTITDDDVENALTALDEDMELDEGINPDSLDINPNLPDNVVNILLIGIDTRSTDMEEGYQHGDVQIVCSINKDTGAIKLTSFLRDSYVTIPGYRNKNRINVKLEKAPIKAVRFTNSSDAEQEIYLRNFTITVEK